MAKKAEKSGAKGGGKSSGKNGGKNGAKTDTDGTGAKPAAPPETTVKPTGTAATPGPPAPPTQPLGSSEVARSTATLTPSSPSSSSPSSSSPSSSSPSSSSPSPSSPSTTAASSTRPATPGTTSTGTTPTAGRSSARTTSVAPTGIVSARGGGITDEIAQALLLPMHVAQRVMPARRAPVYLGAAALTVIGLIEWPVALGAGLAWEALRRWGPDRREH